MTEPVLKSLPSGQKKFLAALHGGVCEHPPFWLMRQAGRYLPEYRELRKEAGSFLDLVYNPDFATEVTLQPLRRYGMDAAILFSDILVIPQALGQHLEFVIGEGPKLDALKSGSDIDALAYDDKILEPVYQTIKNLRKAMPEENFSDVALIGFAGAPWTVATYMIEGGGSKNFERIKKWAYAEPESFLKLIDVITQATISYLKNQIDAGAEALQIFDSWASVLDEKQYRKWVIAPAQKITAALKQSHPHIPVIGFPKGSGILYETYATESGVTALGLDSSVPLSFAKKLQQILPVQGNLDPVALLAGGKALENAASEIMSALSEGAFVFNLGHGVIKETPPEHVEQLRKIIRGEG